MLNISKDMNLQLQWHICHLQCHTCERVEFNEHLRECIAFVSGNLEQAVSNFVFNPSVVTWPDAINRLGWPLRMYHIIVPG